MLRLGRPMKPRISLDTDTLSQIKPLKASSSLLLIQYVKKGPPPPVLFIVISGAILISGNNQLMVIFYCCENSLKKTPTPYLYKKNKLSFSSVKIICSKLLLLNNSCILTAAAVLTSCAVGWCSCCWIYRQALDSRIHVCVYVFVKK